MIVPRKIITEFTVLTDTHFMSRVGELDNFLKFSNAKGWNHMLFDDNTKEVYQGIPHPQSTYVSLMVQVAPNTNQKDWNNQNFDFVRGIGSTCRENEGPDRDNVNEIWDRMIANNKQRFVLCANRRSTRIEQSFWYPDHREGSKICFLRDDILCATLTAWFNVFYNRM